MDKMNGPFKDIIPNFINYKKSLGYKYNNTNSYFLIDKILYKHKIYDLSNTKKIFQVLINDESSINRRKKFYQCLKEIYDYLTIIGFDRNDLYFEYDYNYSQVSNFKPHILNDKELSNFFKIIDNSYKENNEDICYPVLFRLIYGCGLRVSDALNLKISDFSLENKTIFIKEAKGYVSRLLPLSNSMYKILKIYKENILTNNKEYLFEYKNKKVNYEKIKSYFDDISKENNWYFRIHDLRHTFSVNSFNKLYDEGKTENWIMYYLNIYLGHKDMRSTEIYLHLTYSRFIKASKLFNKKNKDLFPNIGGINEK